MMIAAMVWHSFCSKAKTYVCVASACVWHRLCKKIVITLCLQSVGMVFAVKQKLYTYVNGTNLAKSFCQENRLDRQFWSVLPTSGHLSPPPLPVGSSVGSRFRCFPLLYQIQLSKIGTS